MQTTYPILDVPIIFMGNDRRLIKIDNHFEALYVQLDDEACNIE